jgi:catechol 2,3-dioxygenase-like lactoylglutathione lyase family enzyme
MTALPLTGAWQEAVVSVRDLDRWGAALDTLFGWHEVERSPIDKRLLSAWQLPSSVTADERVFTNPQDDTRRVRFMKFSGIEQVQVRSSAMGWDTGGVFSLLCYARDVDATFKAAQELGWSAYHDPVNMQFGDRTLRNVVLRAWDGVNFGLYCPTIPPPPAAPLYSKVSAPFNGQQMVREIAPARRFYADLLGWTSWFDGTLRLNCNNFGMPANFVGVLPKNVAIMAGGKSADGAWDYGQVELVQWDGFAGRDLAEHALPPNLGILALRVPVTDAVETAKLLIARGAILKTPPCRVAIPLHGEVMICAVRTPDGALIEYFSVV